MLMAPLTKPLHCRDVISAMIKLLTTLSFDVPLGGGEENLRNVIPVLPTV